MVAVLSARRGEREDNMSWLYDYMDMLEEEYKEACALGDFDSMEEIDEELTDIEDCEGIEEE